MCASPEPPVPRRQVLFVVLVAGVASLAIAVAAWKIFSIIPNSERMPSATPPIPSAARPVGRPAPDFTLPLFSGGTLNLHSLKGKPVLLNFWASWCVPCREETPLLVRLHKTYRPRGIVFVGVNVEDDERAARAFLQQYHVDYPVVHSVDDGLIDAYAIPGIPTTVFIGANGVVVDKFSGGFVGPSGEKALVTRLERLLGAPQP
jgi:cytochrome c biogenesis protein CcmG/thiol:disulfide interchange protein DsbE